MPTLVQHPFCPHSRFVRLIAAEMGLTLTLVEERPWEWRQAFLLVNPAGETPVLFDEPEVCAIGAEPIAEYLDETRGLASPGRRLLPEGVADRLEVRRLCGWFHHKFFAEVSSAVFNEKIVKRFAGGAPDMQPLRAARHNLRTHLRYIGHLVRHRNWLAGEDLTYADLAAAAHLSVVDYGGDVPWAEDGEAKEWYCRVKSRPAFRPLLAERLPGIPPAAEYLAVDF
jgi:glutathione S-transferase